LVAGAVTRGRFGVVCLMIFFESSSGLSIVALHHVPRSQLH
jgi:hypothetical protein